MIILRWVRNDKLNETRLEGKALETVLKLINVKEEDIADKSIYINFDRNKREQKMTVWIENLYEERDKKIEIIKERHQQLNKFCKMEESEIDLIWTEKGIKHKRNLKRNEVYSVFKGIEKGFVGDNEIAKKLIKIIPIVDKIYINKDYNETQDVPFIIYYVGEESKIIKIIRYHKIIWAILDKYCTE